MLNKKIIRCFLCMNILLSQGFAVKSANVDEKKLNQDMKSFQLNFKNVDSGQMCEYYFMKPFLFEAIILLRAKILNFEISKIIGEIDTVINTESSFKKINFQKEELNKEFVKESENLLLGIQILSSMEQARRMSDYFILISSLGKIFNSFNSFMSYLGDLDSIVEIKKKIVKVQKDFYTLLFDPLSSTIKYAHTNKLKVT